MKIACSGTSIIINSKFQEVARQLPEKCAETVIADWPFNKGIVDAPTRRTFSDGVKLANRLLKPNGTLISVNYLEPNFYVWKEAEYWGLTFADNITLLRHPIKKVKHRLAYETLSVLIFTKGRLESRILNTACREKGGNLIYSKDEWKVTTDFWDEMRFKNGYRRKNGDRVSEAMPESFVQRCIRTFCSKDGIVVDFFGGAGTIPVVCRKLGIKCISTEILSDRFQIISRRLSEKNQKLIQLSNKLLDKALDAMNTGPYTKGDNNGKETGYRWEGKRQACGQEEQICSQ